ncbi:hypothetical protein T4C_4062 [Trichinella pseudospiralis]|uniref:Uncharacterized protein n=1 Tax=Trichinella pseudospiralis TaxID=6337 RepID=A0A0V1JMH2_TRIPS|nr:hypothetical protein T4C_4062 [Trichinella pseudospiralis]
MQGCLTGTTLDTIEGADPSTGRNWLAFCELQMVLGKGSLGRIREVLTGADGLAPSASVKNATGTIRKSIRSHIFVEPAT